MNLTGNTIFITGGGSGIGRGLAEELHRRRNKVIISGRRKSHLDSVAKANPGIEVVELDIANPDSIKAVAKKLTAEQIRADHAANQARINARYGPALPSSSQLRGEADAAHHWAVISHARANERAAVVVVLDERRIGHQLSFISP
jgi:short-subunit dehydrogenase involved in D-alanine esterification of teichoic acids